MVFSFFLALVKEGTKEQIEYQKLKALVAPAVKAVLPPSDNDPIADRIKVTLEGEGKKAKVVTVFPAKKGGKLFALAYSGVGSGHGGPVESLVAVTMDGKIIGVKVVKHSETPGIGDKVVNSPEFMNQFKGKSLNSKIALDSQGGEIQAVSGATETSTAITQSVANAMKIFPVIKNQVLQKTS
ncbi:MAG: RnfABCDGE type electron transport complex subunit G [Candidatus Desulfofervidaceae bacterium]|nr:RnfABCDGE type electron transport complex subunit G [Candidatus Desulfofervidaceae bacterium]MDL1969367.1 RnfABCDGE type electron transport complex subunit G [Candidatus Desulfofervidaceae bacterium]